jgi:hypothetical protein
MKYAVAAAATAAIGTRMSIAIGISSGAIAKRSTIVTKGPADKSLTLKGSTADRTGCASLVSPPASVLR